MAIYYQQKWRDLSVVPDPTLKPPELAEWVEQQAYDAWLALKPANKNADSAYPFMVPGAPLLPSPTLLTFTVAYARPNAAATVRAVRRCNETKPRARHCRPVRRQVRHVA